MTWSIAPSATRVERAGPDAATDRVRRQTAANLAYYARHHEAIDVRLAELEREWDIERALQANAAALTLASTLLAKAGYRAAGWLPALVGGFLLQHALQGWCPPMPVLRRMGFRTAREIAVERAALQALRGDFDDVDRLNPDFSAERALIAAESATAPDGLP
jgi:hypothetical protein